jgi:hypothetical protein
MHANQQKQLRVVCRPERYRETIAGSGLDVGAGRRPGFYQRVSVRQGPPNRRSGSFTRRLPHAIENLADAGLVAPPDQFKIGGCHPGR